MIETLSVGATMLLPPLRERMELLHSLLPQGPDRWESLSKGQVPDATYCVDGAARCFKQPVKNSPPPSVYVSLGVHTVLLIYFPFLIAVVNICTEKM